MNGIRFLLLALAALSAPFIYHAFTDLNLAKAFDTAFTAGWTLLGVWLFKNQLLAK